MREFLIVLGDQGLAEFTANVCKRFIKSLDMHPLCRYLVNHLKAHQSFNLIVLEYLLTMTTVRACIGRGPACACSLIHDMCVVRGPRRRSAPCYL